MQTTYNLGLKELRLAREGCDAERYVSLCGELGMAPEDEYLVERVEAERWVRSHWNMKSPEEIDRGVVPSVPIENPQMVTIANIALRRFERGHVTKGEILLRLRRLRDNGYAVQKGFDSLSRDQLWDYFTGPIHQDVRDKARHGCPRALERIDYDNRIMIDIR